MSGLFHMKISSKAISSSTVVTILNHPVELLKSHWLCNAKNGTTPMAWDHRNFLNGRDFSGERALVATIARVGINLKGWVISHN